MRPRVALLPWGDVFEDWLDPLGVTPEVFRDEMTGSWMFGYVDALRLAGVDTILVCFTTRVVTPVRWTHAPTGATLYLLPPGRGFAAVSSRMLREPIGDRRDPAAVGGAVLRNIAPYLATPVAALVRLVRVESCTAILCQEYETPRFDACILAGALTRLPVFASFQGGDYHVSRLEGVVRPRTMGRAERLIVATQREIKRIQARYGVPSGKIARIFNPIDVNEWRPRDRVDVRSRLGVDQEVILVAWHGQLQMQRKGLDLLLDAWREITHARPGCALELRLIGAGADESQLRTRISERRLDGVSIVDGWVNDREHIADLLAAADVYVFPSRHEGFPMAPIEAMACGLPVVAACAQGLPDIFASGPLDGGVLVPQDDAPALAAALGTLIDDEGQRLQLGRRARERAMSAFSLETVGRELRRVLLRETA
jgi:glycosyltransferase involved in cell wall biosynthesis